VQGAGLGIKIYEDEIKPFLDADRGEAELLGIEIFDAVEFWSNQESAVEAVGPAVVRAAEEFAVAAPGGGVAGTMAADIVKATKNAVFAASDEQGLSDQVKGEIVAGGGRLAHMAYKLPGGSKQSGLFVLEGGGVEVERCGQSGGASYVALGI
jgi:hypothetical protein